MDDKYGGRVVATGMWMYDRTIPRKIEVCARPAQFAASRFNYDSDDFQVDESTPIPQTLDGCVYSVGATSGVDFHTLEDAKKWADAQPWGPVKWDQTP